MLKYFGQETQVSLRALLFMSVLCGLLYPCLVTGFAKLMFSQQSNGSLVYRDGELIGSELIGQKFNSPRYFHGRPSASDYGTLPSGASNMSATSFAWKESVEKRRFDMGADTPSDMLTASGSGLDPHTSIEAAKHQIARIIAARGLSEQEHDPLAKVILDYSETPQWGFMGLARVNVLMLNIELDRRYP